MPDKTSKLTLDTYFDKIFYINLKDDTDRNKHILGEFKKYGINNYERVDAVKLKDLPDAGKYRNFNKQDEKYLYGQMSCRASHIKCIKIAKQHDYTRILILEDDIVFLEDPNKLLHQNEDLLNDWDMLYFGGLIEPEFRNQIVCAHAYGIRSILYEDILNMAETSGMEIDNFYAKVLQHMSYNHNQSGKYNVRTIYPFNQVVQNAGFGSNIQG